VADPEAIEALLTAAREQNVELEAFVTTLLDAGLRRGEALALRWRCVAWGIDENDKRRHVRVEASRSRTQEEDG